MVETARGTNGKFVKGINDPSPIINGSASGNVRETPAEHSTVDAGSINPASIDQQRDAGSEPGKRGRGRPKGQPKQDQAKSAETPGKLDLDSLNFTLFYAHSLLAKVTATPEIALDESEAKSLSTACMNVMQHYNIKASQKAIDWGNLLLTMGILYGAKFHAIHARQETAKKTAKEERAAHAAPFGLSQ